MPHASSAVASCGWGYDAVARLRRAVGSTLGRVSDMLLTLWALRWCWVGMLAVVAYLRHAVSRGCVESRHALLRSAYRVTAECRRSATMSADVGGDVARRCGGHTLPLLREAMMGDGVTACAVGTRHYGGWGGCYKLVMKKFVEKFAKSLCKSYLCNELRDRTLN